MKRLRNTFKITSYFFLTVLLVNACSSNDPKPFVPVIGNSEYELYINEIKATGDPEYMEIFNPGMESVNLEGFFIFDDPNDKYTIPAGIVVPANGFVIFNCNGLAIGNNTNFRLSANGEQVVLEDPLKNVVDFIEYDEIDNNRVLGRFPDGSVNLFLSGISTPENTNGDAPAAYLENFDQVPLVPTISQSVDISIEGYHDQNQITGMHILYRVDGGSYDSVGMASLNDSLYLGAIPATGADAVIDYYISAIDQNGLRTTAPYGAPTNFSSYIIDTSPLPQLLINEFLAGNNTCCPDRSSGVDEFDDWFEIYNAGTVPVDIGGFYVTDDSGDPFRYRIPDNESALTTINPGGFLLIWADGEPEQGALHTNFRLSLDGETVSLQSFDGRVIDAYEFGVQTADVSTGRSPDGSANWVTFTQPTPGISNQ